MSVILRPVAITDLRLKYCRDMGDNKLRHYIIPTSLAIIKRLCDKTPSDIVTDFIQQTEGEQHVEIVDNYSGGVSFEDDGDTALMGAVDISQVFLKKDKGLKKALKRVSAKSLLHQWNYYPTIFHRYRDVLAHKYNKYVVPLVNKFLYWAQGADHNTYSAFVKQISNLKLIYLRRCEPVRFFAVAFDKRDIEEATESLLNDLRILNQNGVIMGHLAMPSMLPLANLTGADTSYFVIFCFVVCDSNKMNKIAGYGSPLDVPREKSLNMLGTKNEVYEGSTNWLNGVSPEQKYQIEEVVIRDLEMEKAEKLVLESYEKSRDFVNDVASKAKVELNKWEKISSSSQDGHNANGFGRTVAVEAEFLNKETGEVRKVSDMYRKNSQ